MRTATGDLWTYPAQAIVIPINWRTKKNGEAVMGAGVAKQAAQRWPWLPRHLGLEIAASKAPKFCIDLTARMESDGPVILSVPTKRDWRDPADLGLIALAPAFLVTMADHYDWQTVALPRLGCGLGQLRWEDVRPVLAPILDDRFVVVTKGAGR